MIVLMDMGSAVMTAEMVLEAMPERKLVLADCPLVEGAVAATVSAIAGSSLDQIMDELADVRELKSCRDKKKQHEMRTCFVGADDSVRPLDAVLFRNSG